MTLPKIEKRIRANTPYVGTAPFGQVHAHSTGNRSSTAQNEADYAQTKNRAQAGFFTHVVGNGRVIQLESVNRGAWDVGGGWNKWSYASVELIESHKTKEDFLTDYKIYVELLRKLAKDGNVPIKVDGGNLGILSHDYCRTHQPDNQTDHVDPYPYLAKWGISRAQFKKDVEGGSVTAKPSDNELKPVTKQIAVDGKFGPATARRLQEVLGTRPIDGVISGQYRTSANQNVYAAKWGTSGSNVVRTMQTRMGLVADGNIGPATVKALQRRYGTKPVDGVISPVSNMVKAMQRSLNKGKF